MTPGVTARLLLVGALSWRGAAARGAGFAAAAGVAFAVGIEKRMRRAWLGSMPNDVTATTRALNTRNFFRVPPSDCWR
jgi:hypothetical protein